jgi:antibiotic biosynthesis monooxygenase (ABM) superfamily enzyme
MAVVTWLGIFPLVLVLSQLVGPWLVPIHPLLSVMVVTALVTLAMTWLVMPGLARLFAGWLYPKLAESLPDGPNRQPSITQSAEKP